jgi:antitoxin HicB
MTTTERRPLSDYLGMQYPFNVIADPDGGYVVVFPDLPGCMTQVETLAELPAMAEDARTGWMATEYEQGHEIPLPSHPPDYGEYSGKFVVRLPRSLHRALAEGAEREGVSLNQYVLSLLSAGMASPGWGTRGPLAAEAGAPVWGSGYPRPGESRRGWPDPKPPRVPGQAGGGRRR